MCILLLMYQSYLVSADFVVVPIFYAVQHAEKVYIDGTGYFTMFCKICQL